MAYNHSRPALRPLASLIAALLAAFVLGSCANPTASTSGQYGSLSVSVPPVAAWITQFKTQQGAAPSAKGSARAFAYLSKVVVSLVNSSGSTVSSTTMTWSSTNLSSSSYVTLPMLPPGTDYTVKVDGYNEASSTTEPMVHGEASGITITKGSSTSASVTCLPVAATALSLDTGATVSLASTAEKWYSLAVTSGTAYYFTQTNGAFAMCLFGSDGKMIGSGGASYLSYTASATGTVFLVVAAVDNYSSAAAGDTVVTASTTQPATSEGTQSAPITLTEETSHLFLLPSSGNSYYQFTTGDAGDYGIELPCYSWISYGLYTGSIYGTQVVSSSGSQGALFPSLQAGTTYYLTLGYASYTTFITGKLVGPTTLAAYTKNNNGSPSSPVALTIGTATTGKAGYHYYDQRSYYSFTTDASNVDYALKLENVTGGVSAYVSSTSSTNGQIAYLSSYSSSATSVQMVLKPSTSYYVIVSNNNYSAATTYDLTISTASAPSFIALPLATKTEGSLSGSTVWYKADVTAGNTYQLLWDDRYDSASSYTTYISVSAYQADRVTPYFTSAYSGYTSGKIITIPAGDTALYIGVSSGYGTYALTLKDITNTGSIAISAQ
jgi:hypothetical protein